MNSDDDHINVVHRRTRVGIKREDSSSGNAKKYSHDESDHDDGENDSLFRLSTGNYSSPAIDTNGYRRLSQRIKMEPEPEVRMGAPATVLRRVPQEATNTHNSFGLDTASTPEAKEMNNLQEEASTRRVHTDNQVSSQFFDTQFNIEGNWTELNAMKLRIREEEIDSFSKCFKNNSFHEGCRSGESVFVRDKNNHAYSASYKIVKYEWDNQEQIWAVSLVKDEESAMPNDNNLRPREQRLKNSSRDDDQRICRVSRQQQLKNTRRNDDQRYYTVPRQIEFEAERRPAAEVAARSASHPALDRKIGKALPIGRATNGRDQQTALKTRCRSGKTSSSNTSRSTAASRLKRKRPQGRPPKNKEWNGFEYVPLPAQKIIEFDIQNATSMESQQGTNQVCKKGGGGKKHRSTQSVKPNNIITGSKYFYLHKGVEYPVMIIGSTRTGKLKAKYVGWKSTVEVLPEDLLEPTPEREERYEEVQRHAKEQRKKKEEHEREKMKTRKRVKAEKRELQKVERLEEMESRVMHEKRLKEKRAIEKRNKEFKEWSARFGVPTCTDFLEPFFVSKYACNWLTNPVVEQPEKKRRLYYAADRDTATKISNKVGVPVERILYDNRHIPRFKTLNRSDKLRKNTVLVLPEESVIDGKPRNKSDKL